MDILASSLIKVLLIDGGSSLSCKCPGFDRALDRHRSFTVCLVSQIKLTTTESKCFTDVKECENSKKTLLKDDK